MFQKQKGSPGGTQLRAMLPKREGRGPKGGSISPCKSSGWKRGKGNRLAGKNSATAPVTGGCNAHYGIRKQEKPGRSEGAVMTGQPRRGRTSPRSPMGRDTWAWGENKKPRGKRSSICSPQVAPHTFQGKKGVEPGWNLGGRAKNFTPKKTSPT